MTSDFYTNVHCMGDYLFYRGYTKSGGRVETRIKYSPKLYIKDQSKESLFKSLSGENLTEVKLDTIREARDFLNRYKGVSGFNVFGMQRFEYAYLAETFPEEINYRLSLIRKAWLDIEVGSDEGFPNPEDAEYPVTAITYKMGDTIKTFALGDYFGTETDYKKCESERELLIEFLVAWERNCPDIISGWNVKQFDMQYLINRITKLLGRKNAERLSPWGKLRKVNLYGRATKTEAEMPVGIAILDYLELYKKYAPEGKSRESYRLDFIAHEELGEKKIDYSEYKNLAELYKKDHDKFIRYNIHDVILVERLDKTLNLIDQAITLAYVFKVNYEDVFTQVRMWDVGIYNELLSKNIIVPIVEGNSFSGSYEGAYVKPIKAGMFEWVVSFDLNSLYPMIICQYNISPDTIINDPKIKLNGISVDSLVNEKVNTASLKEHNMTVTPNNQYFTVDKPGFLPVMIDRLYKNRSLHKNKMLEYKALYEKETDPDKKQELSDLVSKHKNMQLAMKVSLNSSYGALGNKHFRFFDTRQAEAITKAGQLSILWIEKHLNDYLNRIIKTNNVDYVIAIDTDSLYLNMDGFVKRLFNNDPPKDKQEIVQRLDEACKHLIQPKIDQYFSKLAEYVNAYQQRMIMKRENIADRGFWSAIKKYVLSVWDSEGIRYEKPDIKITGLQVIQSSTPTACKPVLRELIEIMISGNESKFIDRISSFKKEFRSYPLSDISFPRGINGIEDYTVVNEKGKTKLGFVHDESQTHSIRTPIHVKGSISYNRMIKDMGLSKKYQEIQDGDKLRFVYLKEPNPTRTNVISFPLVLPEEMGLDKYIDFETQFEKSFLEPARQLGSIIGWKAEKFNTLW